MLFEGIVKGNVIDICKGKGEKIYIKVYNGKGLTSIFQSDSYKFHDVKVGDQVEVPVQIITNDCFVKANI